MAQGSRGSRNKGEGAGIWRVRVDLFIPLPYNYLMENAAKSTDASPSRFLRLSLIQKLITGYVAMALFTMAALVFSYFSLFSINRTAREIANNDLPVISALTGLRTSLLAQEGYAGKYAIFKGPEFIDLFHQREKEFLGILATLERSNFAQDSSVVKRMYLDYRAAAAKLFAGETKETGHLRAMALHLLDTVDVLYKNRQALLQDKLETADSQESSTIKWTIAISFTGFLLAILVAVVFTYRAFTAIRKLQMATHRIAEGDFDYDPQIPAGDEIGDLARDFTRMAARLKVLEQMSLDASPLTRLPGNIAIERVLNKRLQSGEQFALCYADLDNFKAFGDRYGYIKGSELIKLTGEIIYEAVKSHADKDAFVGHVGGDDFVMVVSAETAAAVCETVIGKFDAEVVKHYNAEDRAKGGIEGFDRYGVHRFFPLMTISIAVIINDEGEFVSAVDIAKTAAEIKDYVKEKPGSSYLISRRRKHAR